MRVKSVLLVEFTPNLWLDRGTKEGDSRAHSLIVLLLLLESAVIDSKLVCSVSQDRN